jgi:hypothetical protein
MLLRRSDFALSPQDVFEIVLYHSFTWTPKTILLERNSISDYAQRSMSSNLSISELYHENSKLYSQILPELAATRVSVEELRRTFVERRVTNAKRTPIETAEVNRLLWYQTVKRAAETIDPSIFYSIDLRVVAEGSLIVVEPYSGSFQLVRNLSADDQTRLWNAVCLIRGGTKNARCDLIFLIGSFARNELIFGSRGYRRVLVEAGRLVEAILSSAKRLGVMAETVIEFADHEIDKVVEADGIESGTVAIIELG